MKKRIKFDTATVTVLLLAVAVILITLIASMISNMGKDGDPKITTNPPKLTYPDVSDVPQRDEITVTHTERVLEDTYANNGIEYIYSFISYPNFEGTNDEAISKINGSIEEFAVHRVTINDFEKTNAEDAYNRAQSDAMGFVQFEFITTTESIYVKNGYVSIMFRRVRTVGLNEPAEFITTMCFDLLTGEQVDISAFMNTDPSSAEDFVYDVFAQHIRIYPNLYYNDALETLPSIIDLKAFYLTENGATLYFNPDTITPSVMGVRYFNIPYDKIGY